MKKYSRLFCCFWLIGLCFVCFYIHDCYGDIFYLKNGKVIEGKTIRQDDKKIWVATFNNVTMGINREDIESIEAKEFTLGTGGKTGGSGDSAAKAKKKHGYGTITSEVTYSKPSQEGSTDGDRIKTIFKSAQYKDGQAIYHDNQYYDNGNLKMSIVVKNGKADGRYDKYYASGILEETGFYKEGVKVGRERKFFPSGKLQSEALYENGKKHGICRIFYETGIPEKELIYENDKQSGYQKYYHDNGQISSESVYIDDKPIGVIKRYYPTGALSEEEHSAQARVVRYFESGKIKAKLFMGENKYIEYDQEGAVLYDGDIPPQELPQAAVAADEAPIKVR